MAPHIVAWMPPSAQRSALPGKEWFDLGVVQHIFIGLDDLFQPPIVLLAEIDAAIAPISNTVMESYTTQQSIVRTTFFFKLDSSIELTQSQGCRMKHSTGHVTVVEKGRHFCYPYGKRV